jgi:hypothetical protein
MPNNSQSGVLRFLLLPVQAASGDAERSLEESHMFRRLAYSSSFIVSRLLIICGLILAVPQKAETQDAGDTFEAHVGHGKVNIVDFRKSPNSGGLPLVFRCEYKTFESVPSDGFFGRITRGKMTFSLPRQNNPEVAYDKTASLSARLTQGPAFGDTVDYQAREIGPNVFEVHYEPEPRVREGLGKQNAHARL